MEGVSKQIVLTFVVPCYNVEHYVQHCLDSIYACDLPEADYEVLCINDCSPDNTQQMLESYENNHDNLRIVVHEHNRGLGGARNTGVCEARGKYLWFVDSDDSICGQRLKNVVEAADIQRLDVLCFNYRRVGDSGKELSNHIVFQEMEAQGGYSFVKKVFGASIVHHMGYVWRFLYRTEYLRENKFFFPEKVYWEDTVFMPKALLEADRVASISDILYAYRVNAESISGVFVRAYPAKLIYQYAFCAGKDLLDFSNEVKDEELKEAFRDTAVQRYINGFPIHLFRTGKGERKQFYTMIRNGKEEIKPLKRYVKLFPKMLLLPIISRPLAEVCALLYGLRHKRK